MTITADFAERNVGDLVQAGIFLALSFCRAFFPGLVYTWYLFFILITNVKWSLSKLLFTRILRTFSSQTCGFFYFWNLTAQTYHSTYTTSNWGTGSIGGTIPTCIWNRIRSYYRKVSLSKCASTTLWTILSSSQRLMLKGNVFSVRRCTKLTRQFIFIDQKKKIIDQFITRLENR